MTRRCGAREGIARGGYVLADAPRAPQLVMIATGSELQVVAARAGAAAERGHRCAWCRCRARACSTARTESLPRRRAARRLPAVAVEAGSGGFLAEIRRPPRRRRRHVGPLRRVGARGRPVRATSASPRARWPTPPQPACSAEPAMLAYDLVLFDLDGTLVETAPDCRRGQRHAARVRLDEASQAQVEAWIGHGTGELLVQAVATAAGMSVEQVRGAEWLPQVAAVFDRHYEARCGTRSRPCSQAREVLHYLRQGARRRPPGGGDEQGGRVTPSACSPRTPCRRCSIASSAATRCRARSLTRPACRPAWATSASHASGIVRRRLRPIDAATARNAGVAVWLLPHGYNLGRPIPRHGLTASSPIFGVLRDALGGRGSRPPAARRMFAEGVGAVLWDVDAPRETERDGITASPSTRPSRRSACLWRWGRRALWRTAAHHRRPRAPAPRHEHALRRPGHAQGERGPWRARAARARTLLRRTRARRRSAAARGRAGADAGVRRTRRAHGTS